jgi:hypothetical protein
MSKFLRFFIAAVMICGAALLTVARPALASTVWQDVQWVAPDGLPEGVSVNEYNLYSPFIFNFNGTNFGPPEDWMLFGGDGFFVQGELPPPVKICFNYPKILFNGDWNGQIFFLNGDEWVGMPTTIEYLADYPDTPPLPFLCTFAAAPGMYIVGDYWTPE